MDYRSKHTRVVAFVALLAVASTALGSSRSCEEVAQPLLEAIPLEESAAVIVALEEEGCAELATQAKLALSEQLRTSGPKWNGAEGPARREYERLIALLLQVDPNEPVALLGKAELSLADRDFKAAADAAGKAMMTLLDWQEKKGAVDKAPVDDAPVDEELLQRSYLILGQARALHDEYLAFDTTRSQSLCNLKMRSARYAPPPEPVQFKHNSAEFTKKGQLAADALAWYFASNCTNGRGVVLTGHTDPDGTATHNCDLSQRRADALKEHILRQVNRTGTSAQPLPTIAAVGLGEMVPRSDIPKFLSTEEKKELLRRVEFREGNAPAQARRCDTRVEDTNAY